MTADRIPQWQLILEKLLEMLLPHGTQESILGDLRERAQARRLQGRFGSIWWVRRVLTLSTSLAAHRLRILLRRLPETARRTIRMSGFARDLHHAYRSLLRNPAFALAAAACIALGVGAVTAVFSVVDAVILRPLPYADPERLVVVREKNLENGRMGVLSPSNYRDFRDNTVSFEGMAAWRRASATLTDGRLPVRVTGRAITHQTFETLGVPLPRGRDFRLEEDFQDPPPLVIVSHQLWQGRLGGRDTILEESITLDGRPFRVVGIAPRGFRLPGEEGVDFFVSAGIEDVDNRGGKWLRAVGRLKAGASVAEARADIEQVARTLSEEYTGSNSGIGGAVAPLRDHLVGDFRTRLWMLLSAVALLLVLASVNVANLMLARASSKEGEFAVRLALGAGRRRLLSHSVAESLLLALGGGTLGVLLAIWGTSALLSLARESIPRLEEVAFDGRVLAIALASSVASALIFSTAPGAVAARMSLARVLSQGRGQTRTSQNRRTRRIFAGAQVALALVLLIGAALLIHSFSTLLSQDRGFRPQGVLTADVSLDEGGYPDGSSQSRFFEALLQRLNGRSDVLSAGASLYAPMSGGRLRVAILFPGRGENEIAQVLAITPNTFETLGMRLIAGRTLAPTDGAAAPSAVWVNETAARLFWPGEDPIGKELKLTLTIGDQPDYDRWRTVAGIVGDVRFRQLAEPADAQIFVPSAQYPVSGMTLLIRTEGDPMRFAGELRLEVAQMDPDLAVAEIAPLEDLVAGTVAEDRFYTVLLSLFAAVALALSAIGIAGVLAFSVTQRRSEMGVRLALGADRRQLVRLIVREGALVTLTGVAAGLAVSAGLTRLLEGVLFGIGTLDPWSFAGAVVVLAATALLACWLPATRAGRVDPMEVLRTS